MKKFVVELRCKGMAEAQPTITKLFETYYKEGLIRRKFSDYRFPIVLWSKISFVAQEEKGKRGTGNQITLGLGKYAVSVPPLTLKERILKELVLILAHTYPKYFLITNAPNLNVLAYKVGLPIYDLSWNKAAASLKEKTGIEVDLDSVFNPNKIVIPTKTVVKPAARGSWNEWDD